MANPNPERSPETEFKSGNQANLVHGGEGAVKAIQRGEPLRGPAREAELVVYGELETEGRFHLVRRNAARLQAACDLYWAAIARLVERVGEGEPADVMVLKLDRYVKRFGWLAGASLRAWAQVREEEKDAEAGTLTISRIIEADSNGDDQRPD